MASLVDGVNGFIVTISLMTFRDKEKLLLDSGLLSRFSGTTGKSALRVVSDRMRGQSSPVAGTATRDVQPLFVLIWSFVTSAIRFGIKICLFRGRPFQRI